MDSYLLEGDAHNNAKAVVCQRQSLDHRPARRIVWRVLNSTGLPPPHRGLGRPLDAPRPPSPEGLRLMDHVAIHRACWDTTLQVRDTNAMALPPPPAARWGRGGTDAQLGEDTSLLVWTFLVAGFQQLASRRVILVAIEMQQTVSPQMLSPGLVYFEDEEKATSATSCGWGGSMRCWRPHVHCSTGGAQMAMGCTGRTCVHCWSFMSFHTAF